MDEHFVTDDREEEYAFDEGDGRLLSFESCRRWLLRGCLLLVLVGLGCIASLAIISEYITVPFLQRAKVENAFKAIGRASDYIIREEGIPLPEDVILTPQLKNLARQKGFEEFFEEFHQVESCIAAADLAGVRRQDLCTLMELEGGWVNDTKSMTYVIAYATAKGLLLLGYDSDDPEIETEVVDEDGGTCEEGEECIKQCANDTCEAFFAYFAEQEEFLEAFVQLRGTWVLADTVQVSGPGPWWRWFIVAPKFWTLENLGFYSLVITGGGLGIAGEIIILPDPPPVPDGVFAHPYPGSHPSRYFWLQPVIVNGKFRINHPAQDLVNSADSGKTLGGPIVAMHNGLVTFAQMLPASWGLAADWWISGIVVVTYTEVPGDLPMCIYQGHGAVGTLRVSVGDSVGAGKQLFNAGSTGFSSAIHDHVAIKRGGNYPYCDGGGWVNPNTYFP